MTFQRSDVTMRGFESRVELATAVAWVDRTAGRLDAELVELAAAHGRVLAEDLIAGMDVPAFDRAAMDGYAVRGAETDGAGDYNPITFRISGESLPGRPFRGEADSGSAVRIMTGAPVPPGFDAVVPAEFARETNRGVEIATAVPPGKHVGRRGEDIRAGQLLLRQGRRLRPQDVGLIASVGLAAVPVVRRPRVRLVATGNELVSPGQPRDEFQTYDSNSLMLAGLVERDGGVVVESLCTRDDRSELRAALGQTGADLVLVSGGSSVGAEDHAPAVVAELGSLVIHGIAMRPSSPTGLGRLGECLVFLLPGNPVSCLCAYDFFAGRAIRLLGGRSADWPYPARQLPVARKIVSAIGRVDYCRVRIGKDGVEPIALTGASLLSSTTQADGFVVVPAAREGYGVGTTVTVYLYDLG